MANTVINTTDPVTGVQLPVPPDALRAVEKADRMLQDEWRKEYSLLTPAARWQFLQKPGRGLIVEVEVGGTEGKVIEELTMDEVRDPVQVMSKLREAPSLFVRRLSDYVSHEFRRIHRELERLQVAGE